VVYVKHYLICPWRSYARDERYRYRMGRSVSLMTGQRDNSLQRTNAMQAGGTTDAHNAIFIARQHAYACRARYCFTNYIGLSVCPMPILCPNEWTYRHTFWHSDRCIILFFSPIAV